MCGWKRKKRRRRRRRRLHWRYYGRVEEGGIGRDGDEWRWR